MLACTMLVLKSPVVVLWLMTLVFLLGMLLGGTTPSSASSKSTWRPTTDPSSVTRPSFETENQKPGPQWIVHGQIAHRQMVHSFIHSDYFYSASSSPLLLRGAPDTARILCRSFTPKRHRQLRAKNLPKVPMWWPSWIRIHAPSDERWRIYQWATTPHKVRGQMVHEQLVHGQMVHEQMVHGQMAHRQMAHGQMAHNENFIM